MPDPQSSSSDQQPVFDLEDVESKYDLHSFDRYNIERSLGSGAMATVLLATDKLLNRKVAIKVPLIKSEKNTEIIEKRFLREAYAAAKLSHPNICPIYDVGLADDTYYISMGYIDGQPLNDVMVEKDRYEEREAAELIRKIASGMAEAHRQGFVHRDLKPSNIMIDRRGEPIVLDFGLARFFDNSQLNQTLTMVGQTVGTPAYMSPEQALGSREVGPTSDIFALGVILWEMLCGVRPFTGDTMEILGKIVHGPSPSPRTTRPNISTGMEAICLKAIANQSEERYQSMQDLEEALDKLLAGQDVEIPLPSSSIQKEPSHAAIDSLHETRLDATEKPDLPVAVPVWVWVVIGLLILTLVAFLIAPMFDPANRAAQNSEEVRPEAIDLSPATVFPKLDKNNDGRVGGQEMPLHIIQRVDRDGDDRLSFEELEDGYQKLGERMYDTPDNRPAPLYQLRDLWSNGLPHKPGSREPGRGPDFGGRQPPGHRFDEQEI